MASENRLVYDGFPSVEYVKEINGWPSEERFAKGPVAIIECIQEIPCNPCEDACPFGAITVGTPITRVPVLNEEKCTGCGICVAACSGLAIFVVDMNYSDTQATVSFPFEYAPLPEKGDVVDAMNRAGEFVCKGGVVRVVNSAKNDHTAVVTLAIPKEHVDEVRTMKRPSAPEKPVGYREVKPEDFIADDVIVCRCEEITAGEVRQAIRKYGATTVTEAKRRSRAGMGLCQGRTCSTLVQRILREELNKAPAELKPATSRAPARPITFGELAAGGEGDE